MDLFEAIEKRYSVRSYKDEPIDEAVLRRVLDAGRAAPSARNLQQWKFVVVRDADRRAKLAEAAEQPWVKAAPVLIALVSTDPGRTMFCDVPAGPVDCAIAGDHMTLAAVAEGLGACWIGHFKQDACKKILDVPAEAKIVELVALGVPADSSRVKHRKAFDEVVCFESYTASEDESAK